MTSAAVAPTVEAGALTPVLHRVVGTWTEAPGVTTLELRPEGPALPEPRPGQFDMVTALGVGQAPISIAGDPGSRRRYTVRDVGPVSHALCRTPAGATVGVQGPFGTSWTLPGPETDAVVVAGGIGLASLRSAVRHLLTLRGGGRGVTVLLGVRSPEHVVFGSEMDRWKEAGVTVGITCDHATPGWTGPVGLVTDLVATAPFDPSRTRALVCGPEPMLRATARALVARGVVPERIEVSMERNMQCGVGWCGHCQLGPVLLCRDGPVLTYGGRADRLLEVPDR